MRGSTRAGFSQAALALLAVVVIGGAAAGLFFVSMATSPSVAASSFSFASSQILTHRASSHNGTITSTSSTSYSITLRNAPQNQDHFIFGPQVNANNSTTKTIPPNTLAWTSWTLNATTEVFGAQTALLQYPINNNANITAAFYVNGKLAGNETYSMPPIDTPPGSIANSSAIYSDTIYVAMISNRTAPAGAVVSMAIFSPTPITIFFTRAPGVPTNEATLATGSSLPAVLPTITSSLPETMEMAAFNAG